MRTKLLNDHAGQRTFAVILQTGDEAIGALEAFVRAEDISAAQVTALGAFKTAELAYFDWESKSYQPILLQEQVEVASLIGDVALDGRRRPSLHLHAVLGKANGQAMAGHLMKGVVRPTLEVIVTESPAHLRRVRDEETGLALIDPAISA